ncbi:MAG: M23 family metallopeptidase [Lachnospiraceae bacterium]
MKDKESSSRRGKGATVGLVICFVAAIALVGTYTLKNYRDGVKKELALAEKENKMAEKITKKNSAEEANSHVIENQANQGETHAPTKEAPVVPAPIVNNQPEAAAPVTPQAITFSETDKLIWPVTGTILLNFSMDKTVYFATLDQYKYNPAVIISGATGEQVVTAARGTVTAIETSAQTGNTVTIDIGSGFETVYGQLTDVAVAVGDTVNSGAIIGNISEPTKYYSVEGSNLYFEMRKEGTPVNPLDYLDT